MSAFVVNKDHIDLLTSAVENYRRDGISVYVKDDTQRFGYRDALEGMSLDDIGRLLLDENITAVKIRYAASIEKAEVDEYEAQVTGYQYETILPAPINGVHYPMLLLAACDSYEYQASEDPNYRETVAAKLIDAIRAAAIGDLPGYRNAASIARDFTRPANMPKVTRLI